MDRVFEDFGVTRGRLPLAGRPRGFAWVPEVEMIEKDGRLIVRADLPGLTKPDVTLEFADGVLVLRGERKREKDEKGEGFLRSERIYGSFYRAIPLPEAVRPETAKAAFKDGVLEVTFDATPKATAKAKTIAID
jgi:HSP20 family protein